MSGIVGCWRLDRRPMEQSEIQRMLAAIAHRGPHGSGTWCTADIALGAVLRRSVPEGLPGPIPQTSLDGTLILAADARIDNRAELAPFLVAPTERAADLADEEFILRAYARWGERCPEHLLGDFAFAIWDGRRSLLFAARDHFGVRPFCYHHRPGALFAFGSELKALLALPDVPRRINAARVADYLASSLEDRTGTFYADLHRLPPAHRLTATREGVRIEAYWALDPKREIRLGSDAEYAEGFREIFTEAVRCRLRSAGPVGTLLSGGLDSSSIACTARLLRNGAEEPFPTFSAIFDGSPACDERPYIRTVLALGGFEPHWVAGDALSPLNDLDALLQSQDEPFFTPNLFLHWGLYGAARARGVEVLLDGLDGDLTVSHGIGYLEELARSGRWLRLAQEIDGLARRFGRDRRGIFRTHVLRPLTPAPVQRAWRRFRGRAPVPEARERPPRTARAYHHRGLTLALVPAALEVADRAAAAAGLEARYPFFDRRIAEYCLALPGDQKLRGGWTRLVLRHSMEGVLPPAVQWRGGKADLSDSFLFGLARGVDPVWHESLQSASRRHAGYVDPAALGSVSSRFARAPSESDALELWRATVLFRWLDREPITP